MNEQTARQFLQCLAAKNLEQQSDGKKIKCSCPLARWTHKSHKDSNPSFALFFSDTEESHYNCFGCGSGSVEELLQALEMFAASDDPDLLPLYQFKQAHELLANDELSMVDLPGYSEFGADDEKKFKAWPEEYIGSFMNALKHPMAQEYLLNPPEILNQFGQKCRGFPEELVQTFDLRYDTKHGRIVFPYRDAFNAPAGARGRSITEKKHHDYTWEHVNNAKMVWFNEKVLNLPGWVVVVEGQFDAMRVFEGGYPKVVANMTALPSKTKAEKLLYADGTLLIPDNDDTGAKSVEKYREFHKKHKHPFRVLNLPKEVHDPDECHPLYLRDQIEEMIA